MVPPAGTSVGYSPFIDVNMPFIDVNIVQLMQWSRGNVWRTIWTWFVLHVEVG